MERETDFYDVAIVGGGPDILFLLVFLLLLSMLLIATIDIFP